MDRTERSSRVVQNPNGRTAGQRPSLRGRATSQTWRERPGPKYPKARMGPRCAQAHLKMASVERSAGNMAASEKDVRRWRARAMECRLMRMQTQGINARQRLLERRNPSSNGQIERKLLLKDHRAQCLTA